MSKKNLSQTTLTGFIKKKQNVKSKSENSDLSGQSDSNNGNSGQKVQQKKTMINVQFYRNERKSQPSGDYINKIHEKWWSNYALLQRHHGFIQWLFPNSFSSRFNSCSSALTQEQAKIFRTDLQISRRYVKSYEMMLQFYGMKLKSKISGEITQQRIINFKQRYHATLLTSFHNHMRVTRILCSLTMIGFGRYAKQLSLFLHSQIHGSNGNLKLLAKYNVDKDWKIYQDYIQTEQDLNIYLKQAQKIARKNKQKYDQKIKQKFESIQKVEQIKQKQTPQQILKTKKQ